MAEKKTIDIKLLVNKKKNKIVFAECGKDFVDVLFSFLTLPISTIIRSSPQEKSELGSVNSLYRSVESLKDHYFETPGSKSMLLVIKTPSESAYKRLPIAAYSQHTLSLCYARNPALQEHCYYICPTWTCATKTHRLVSMNRNAKCACGQDMYRRVTMNKLMNFDGFVKGGDKFVVFDDLCVRKVGAEPSLSALRDYIGSNAGDSVQERIVSVGIFEVLALLHRSLLSKTPMSDVFLSKRTSVIKSKPMNMNPPIPQTVSDIKMMSLTLLVARPSNKGLFFRERKEEKVVYALAKKDFVEFLFSILTFPVASVMNLVGKSCGVGSLTTLYGSVENLYKEDPKKYKESKDKLLHPKISRYYGSEKPLLKMKIDDQSDTHSILKCESCFVGNVDLAEGESCEHGLDKQNLRLLNPKYADVVCESGGGFIKKTMLFMVTDELKIEPHSLVSCLTCVNKLGFSTNDLEERVVTVGEHEALSILKASLTSKNVLTDVFCNRNKGKSSA